MLLAEFSIWPMDKGESVGQYVARCLDIVDRSGLPYKLGPLGTCVEGEWNDVMRVITQCYEALAADCNRIACTVKMDYRKGHDNLPASIVHFNEQLRIRQIFGTQLLAIVFLDPRNKPGVQRIIQKQAAMRRGQFAVVQHYAQS